MEKELCMIEMKGGDLCEELLEEIFMRVPLKPLTRMKCISKDWCRLISQIPKVSDFVFVLIEKLYDEELYECKTNISLFGIKNRGGDLEYHEYNALGSTLDGDIDRFCYSNGLLLCYDDYLMHTSPFIYDLILKKPISLHTMRITCAGRAIYMGLAYDGLQTRQFKVVCFFFNEDLEFLDCTIFSSETGDWKNHQAKVINYSRMDHYFLKYIYQRRYSTFFQSECLFHDGLIYWTLYGYLIAYNLQENFFEFHDLTRKGSFEDTPIRDRLDECLWVSGGCLHYCYSDKNGLYIWDRFKGEEVDYNNEYFQNEFDVQLHYYLEHHKDWWRQKDEIDLKTLKKQHPEFFCKVWDHNDYIRFLKPCSFNEDLQLLYLQLPGSLIVSYSFETKCLRKVHELKS
ncbi:hypothetical protein AQUCO_00400701v1 [Aquilegia coerulea]|uniref:F-box domain-containing protein n=1 Tax=Aquilegia coerulea TaxID=218851 RepID=A0A2G5EW89_AQUCA|nr:hypothetical protein AQUCO_00400701v1 [Aquilegia coerulea]